MVDTGARVRILMQSVIGNLVQFIPTAGLGEPSVRNVGDPDTPSAGVLRKRQYCTQSCCLQVLGGLPPKMESASARLFCNYLNTP